MQPVWETSVMNAYAALMRAQAAHLMVSSLAGSLALVTCKEPLRVSLSNQLRVLLQQVPQNGLDQAALEQTVQTIVNDNLEVRAAYVQCIKLAADHRFDHAIGSDRL